MQLALLRASRPARTACSACFTGFRVTILLSCLCSAAGANDDIPPPAEFGGVREFIQQAVEQRRAPSVAVGVVRDGRLVWAEGFGFADLEAQRPATANSIYRLASISKPITATGLMMLVEQGRIDLDAPANRYLAGGKLRCYVGAADEITIRRLASHTAGLPLHYSFYYAGTAPPSMDETIRRYGFAATPPGSRWEYSNLAFGVLNHITEIVSGMPWWEYMETRLYDPLGMSRTSDRVRPGCEDDAVVQYNRLPRDEFQAVGHYDFDHPGASAVCSTVHDLARFARMHLDGGALDGVRILAEDSVRQMQVVTGRNGAGEDGCGLSWFVTRVRGRRCIAHSGGMPGVSTALRLFPDDRGATIVLTNGTERSVTTGVSERLAAVLFPDEGSVEAPRPEAVAVGRGAAETRGSTPSAGDPPAPAETLTGAWQGRLAHPDGDLAFTLRIGDSGEGTARLGDQEACALTNLAVDGAGLHGWFSADVPTRPDYKDPPRIELRLRRDGPRLTGVAIAHGTGWFALSHWVELEGESSEAP